MSSSARCSARFDHRDLNQILDNPTAELIAHRVWELLEDAGLSLEGLRLWETSDASVDAHRIAARRPMNQQLVILSGGLDSTVCMALAARRAERSPLALTFDYGQRHRTEIDRAAGVAGYYRSEHLVVHLDTSAWGGSALTDLTREVPRAADGAGDPVDPSSSIPSTYVPARNSIFLSVALGVAEARDLDAVWIGVNAIDYSGYPDCRPEFIDAFRRVAATGQKRGVEGRPIEIVTPLIESTKGGHRAHRARPRRPPRPHLVLLPGRRPSLSGSDACVLRARGFAEVGVPDPALQ